MRSNLHPYNNHNNINVVCVSVFQLLSRFHILPDDVRVHFCSSYARDELILFHLCWIFTFAYEEEYDRLWLLWTILADIRNAWTRISDVWLYFFEVVVVILTLMCLISSESWDVFNQVRSVQFLVMAVFVSSLDRLLLIWYREVEGFHFLVVINPTLLGKYD